MGLPVRRGLMVVVGIATLSVYTAGALGGVVVLEWLVTDAPGVPTLVGVFAVMVLLSTYVGYRVGSLRLLTSLDGRVLPPERAPELYRRLARLTETMRVQRPPVVVADLGAPNALSVGGPRGGTIVLDWRLFELLTVDELEAILAHELAHMEAHDTFVNTLVVTTFRMATGVVAFALFPVVLFLFGVDRATAWVTGNPRQRQFAVADRFQRAVTLVLGALLLVVTVAYLSYSRRREFGADARAADVTGKPVALARALSKIHRSTNPRSGLLSILYIHEEEDDDHLFSTHPPVEDRVDRLLDRVDYPVKTHRIGRLRP